MKIIIHTDEYYPTAAACAYRMQVFAQAFTQLGHEVAVVTSSTNKHNGVAQAQREKILYAPAIRMRKKTTLMRMVNNISFGLTSVFTAAGAGKADVVITTSPPALVSISGWLIAKTKGAKLVYDVRDIWPDVALEMGSFQEDSLYCRVFRNITAFMYKHADLITTVSPGKVCKIKEYVASSKGKKSGPSHADKVRLVGNGFDETVKDSTFDSGLVEQFDLDKKFTCAYVGNIGLAQGLEALLDLAARTKHREVQFLLFGSGADREMLEQRARQEGLANVRFCGVLSHDKVFTLLSSAKMSFISLKNSNMKDSIPTKVYEALGIGCPVLLVAEGDACSIVEESGLGRCVSPDDTGALPRIFDDMVASYEQYPARRPAAMDLMHTKYSRQKIALDFEKQLQQLLEA